MLRILLLPAVVASLAHTLRAADLRPISTQSANTWSKRSPLPDGPVSPRLGYEGACVWDSQHQLVIRYGGHNQGGGGEQGSEVWTFDPQTAKWMLKEPNTSPPGVCCNAQNVYDPTIGRYIRFPKFSGSLKWTANPEEGIVGYRVYRLDGRWNQDPVSRLTPQPISGTTFADLAAGQQTRRYYVVAVDALGQEGFPSSPVWHQREWRAYYEPFVGEWHQ